MELTKEQQEVVINCGVFGYSTKKIASILGVQDSLVEDDSKKKDSQIAILLQKGKDMSDYVIDLKLFEMAKSGDIKALEKLERRKRTR
jgi:hypothetical protein